MRKLFQYNKNSSNIPGSISHDYLLLLLLFLWFYFPGK